jgi:hypothetical protein
MVNRLTFATGRLLFLFLMLTSLRIAAADLVLLAIGANDRASSGCRVDRFTRIEEPSQDGLDYKDHFRALIGHGIPLGQYHAWIFCNEGRFYQRIDLDRPEQFTVLSSTGRVLVSDHVKPKLSIRLVDPPPANETWWVRLAGLYSERIYIDRFEPFSGEATLFDPEPGKYTVVVLSSNGYACTREVEFIEFTRKWVFHPAACSFDFDRFAHLVERDDSHHLRPSRWSEDMRREKEELFRQLKVAADKP